MQIDRTFDPADIAAHREHDHVAAVFPGRAEAQAAIEELRALGLGSEHLGVALRTGDQIVFEHDEDAELIRDTAAGAAAGVSVGAIAGLGLAALAIPGVGVIGVGGMFALAGASALWGGVVGAQLGAAVGEDGWTAHADLEYTALGPDDVLVVVCSHGHADAVRDVVERHGGRWHEVPHAAVGTH